MEDLDSFLFVVPNDHGPEVFDWTGLVDGICWLVVVREADGFFIERPVFPAKDW